MSAHLKLDSMAATPSVRQLKKRSAITMFLADRKAVVGLALFGVFAVVALFAPLLSPYSPTSTAFSPLLAPSAQHWLGTTGTGQDVLSQLIWGTRTSMAVGLGAGVTSTIFAILIGMFGGYRGGIIDSILSTFTNIVLIIPGLPLIIVMAAYVHHAGALTITIVIGLTGWAWGARVLRSQVLTIGRRDFVVAARLAGASSWRVLFTEILPNMLSLVIANLMFASLYGVLAEAGLEFLGLGNVNAVSWGTMLYWSDAGQALLNGAWWWFVPPGIAIALLGASFALINFAIDQFTNPRLRAQGGGK